MWHCVIFLATFSCAEGQSLGKNVFMIFPDNLEDEKGMHDLGKPFKLNVMNGLYEHPVGVRPVVVGDPVKTPSQTFHTFHTELRTAKDILESLNIKGSLTIGYGMFSRTGAAGYASEKGNTKDHRHIEYKTLRVSHYMEFKNPELDGPLRTLFSKDFVDKFGTHYIAKIYFGASCTIRIDMQCSNYSTMSDLKRSLSGFFDALQARGDVERIVEQSEGQLKVTVQADGYGVDIRHVPMSTDVRKVLQYKQDFDGKYYAAMSKGDLSVEDLSVIAYELRPIPSLDFDTETFQERLDTLGRRLVDASYLAGLLKKSREQLERELKSDSKDPEQILDPMVREIEGLLTTVERNVSFLLAWRGLSASTIMEHKDIPESISSDVEPKVKGLAGLGCLKAKEVFKNFGYKLSHVYYRGYLSATEPIYRGELMATCIGKDKKETNNTIRSGRIEELSKIPTWERVWNHHDLFAARGNVFRREKLMMDETPHFAEEGSVIVGLRLQRQRYNTWHFVFTVGLATAKLNNVGGILKMEKQRTWIPSSEKHPVLVTEAPEYVQVQGYEVTLPKTFVAIGAKLYPEGGWLLISLLGAPFDPWCNQVMYDSPDVKWFGGLWVEGFPILKWDEFNDAESLAEGVRFVTGAKLRNGKSGLFVEVQTSPVNWKKQPVSRM